MTNRTTEEIARGLTEAERSFIPTIAITDWWRRDEDTPANVLPALVKQGILEKDAMWERIPIYRLTDLGLAVRSHLESHKP